MFTRIYASPLFLLIASFVAYFLVPGQALAAWQTTEFVVYEGTPIEASDWKAQEDGEDNPSMGRTLLTDIENYLSAVARRLDSMGFADPVAEGALHSLVTNSAGKEAIRIYLHDSDRNHLAVFTLPFPCNSKETRGVIHIFANKFAINGKIADQDYATLAHELFHSVQFASKYYKSLPQNVATCKKRNGWMSEGTADAIGHYMATELRNAKFRDELKDSGFFKTFGLRNYAYPLNIPKRKNKGDKLDAYGTSSFWRHLAEISYSSIHKTKMQGSGKHPEDYRYLAKLLATKFKYGFGPAGEITWLNQAIKSNSLLRGDLATIYPQFVATFADYINTRIGPLGLATPLERQEKWLKRGFGGCVKAEPLEQKKSAIAKIKLKPNASGCFTVKKSGSNSAKLVIQIMSQDKALLEQLAIYMIDGSLVSKPVISENQPPYIATWEFPIFGPYEKTYIISNVAKSPALTKSISPSLHLSLKDWDSNMTSVPPTPPEPSTKQGENGPDNRTLLKQHAKRAKANPEIHLEKITKIRRVNYQKDSQRDMPSCDELELRYNLCGPQLELTLELSPFTNSLPGNKNIASDINFFQFEEHPELDDPTAYVQGYMQSIKKTKAILDGMDASKIAIALPKIDYGFTGTLSNAEIKVSKANGGDHQYLAYGASLKFDTPRAGLKRTIRPLTGVVTIEEYSRLMLRGSFEAELVDTSNPGKPESPIIARSIKGTFLIPAPWIADKNIGVDTELLKQGMIKDMFRSSGFNPEIIDNIQKSMSPPETVCRNNFDRDQLKLMGYKFDCNEQSIGSGSPANCSCDCKLLEKEKQNTDCKKQCSRQWRQCPIADGEIPDDLEAQVAYYKELLTKSNVMEQIHPQLIAPFRKATPQARKMILEALLRKNR